MISAEMLLMEGAGFSICCVVLTYSGAVRRVIFNMADGTNNESYDELRRKPR